TCTSSSPRSSTGWLPCSSSFFSIASAGTSDSISLLLDRDLPFRSSMGEKKLFEFIVAARYRQRKLATFQVSGQTIRQRRCSANGLNYYVCEFRGMRSEEHTSELQSLA